MKIGLEATRANKRQKTGTEWYAWHIIQQFKKIGLSDQFTVFYNDQLEPALQDAPANFYFKQLAWPFKKLWTHLRLGLYLLKKPVEVFFATNAVPLFHRGKLVVTIHDLGFLKNPELYHPLERIYQRLSHWLAIKKSDKIITISSASAQDIIKYYPKQADKVSIVHLGWNQHQFSPLVDAEKVKIREKYTLPQNYLVYAGRIEEKKNISKLIQAYNMSRVDWPLVLIGRPGNYGFEEIKILARSNENIHLFGYIKQDDYGKLLASASALVFPSKYEGFGLPILEAMACGVPVICSNIPALREVGADAAAYFDPNSIDDMSASIARLASDYDLRADLINRGLKRCRDFSWEKCARQTLEILKQF